MPIFIFFFLTVFSITATASDHDAVRKAVEAGEILPLSQILSNVQARYPGRVIDVDLERTAEGILAYEIKLASPEGGQRKLYVNAATGVLLDPPKRWSAVTQSFKPLDSILRDVMQHYPGHIVELELERGRNGRDFYEIKILQGNGRIIEIHIDAVTGKEVPHDLFQSDGLKQVLSLPELIPKLIARYGGVIKEIELEHEKEHTLMYKVEIRFPDGRVTEIEVDAMTGRVLRESEAKY